MVIPFPFQQVRNTRTFSASVSQDELKWHWDEEDREITALQPTDWKLQLDNELPQPIYSVLKTLIKAGQWHRLIKGTGDLVLKINVPYNRTAHS